MSIETPTNLAVLPTDIIRKILRDMEVNLKDASLVRAS